MPDSPDTLHTVNSWLDNLFRPVGRPIGQFLGEKAGDVFGAIAPQYADVAREQFTKAGEALPRFGAEALAYGAKRIPFKALGLADVALRSYTQPGADLEGALAQTGAFALSPLAGRLGARAAGMVAPVAQKAFTSPGAQYLAGQAVERAGGLAGSFVPFEAADALEAYKRGEAFRPFSAENVIGSAASALPFEAMHIPGMVKGYREAISPLVNQTPVSDQAESFRVHWTAHEEQRQKDFLDKQTAFDFADELRKHKIEPFVEPAGMVPRSYVNHSMAFKPGGSNFGFDIETKWEGNLLRATDPATGARMEINDDPNEPNVYFAHFEVPVSERRKGIGSRLLSMAVTKAGEIGKGLEGVVYTGNEQTNLETSRFLEANGAVLHLGPLSLEDYVKTGEGVGFTFSKPVVKALMKSPFIQHSMAFRPEQLQAGLFGLKASEVLNAMPPGDVPGSQMFGTLKNKVPKSELEALPGLEEFVKSQPRIGPEVVQKWLDENAPRVEIKTVGQGALHPDQKAFLEFQHQWYDTFDTSGKTVLHGVAEGTVSPQQAAHTLGISDSLRPEFLANAQKYHDLFQKSKAVPYNPRETSWQSVSPKPESEMKDYVEGAVVVPLKPGARLAQGGATRFQRTSSVYDSDKDAGILFPPSHHFPPNTLGWFRGYMDTANGKKTFHIIEVQSDWAQSVREAKERLQEHREQGLAATGVQGEHPLLSQWERLVLKAAIDHAVKNGADNIAVSDAETAMMTEGHDALPPIDSPTEADIEQAPGMRLHYDQTLPKSLRDLTGEKGEKVSFGEHKMAFEQPGSIVPLGGFEEAQPRPDLIFRNPDGTPKTDTSALSFDLSKTKTELSKRGGFPMFGSEQFVRQHAESMLLEGYDPDQVAKASENVKMLAPLKGETPFQTLARSVGIDPKLFKTMQPGEALPRAFEFLTSMFHYNYGYEPNQAARLAQKMMVPLTRFAPFLKQTAFAIAPAEEGTSKLYGVKTIGSEVFNYLNATFDFPKSPLAARQSPEMQLFEVARSLGHESAHNAIKEALNPVGTVLPEQRRAAIRALVSVEAIPPGERRNVMEGLLKLVVPPKRYPELSKINMETYATSPEEFLADFGALVSVGSTNPRTLGNLRDALLFGDKASQDFSSAIYRDITSIWSGYRAFLRDIMGETMLSREGKIVSKAMDSVYDNMSKLMSTREKAEKLSTGFEALVERMTQGPLDPPPVVSQKQMDSLFRSVDDLDKATTAVLGKALPKTHIEESSKFLDDTIAWIRPWERPRVAGERFSFWRDSFKPMSQLVESLRDKVPSAVPVKALAFDYRGMVSQMQTNTWKLWKPDQEPNTLQKLMGGIADWKRLRWLGKDGSPQERAFTDIALVENVRTQREDATEHLTREQREQMSSAYKSLSDTDKDIVDKSLEQAWGMTRLLARKQWDAHRDRIAWEMSKIIMSYNKGLFHDQAKNLADQAVHWVFDEPGDIEQQPAFRAQKEAFFSSLPMPDLGKQVLEEKIGKNLKPWQDLGDKLLGPQDTFTGERPGKLAYLPEVRVRDWHVAWKMTDEDVPHHESFKSEAQAAQRLKEVKGKEGLEWHRTFNRKDRTERFRGAVQEEISSAQQDALDALLASVLSGISSDHPEAQDIIQRIKSEFQPATAFANVTVSPYMREREFIPGREDLNMVEGLVRYVDAVSYQTAKRHVKQAGQAVLFNPDMRANPDIRNKFENYLNFVTDAEGKEFNFLKNLVFFHYIGFNPATALVEPTQQLITLVPYMVENGMGIGEAYNAIRKANMSVLSSAMHDLKLPDPVENKALQEAITKRTVDTGFVSDLYGETDLDFAAQNSAIMGNDQLAGKADLIKKPLYQLLAIARHAYGIVTSTNGKVAFLTAFRHEYARSGDYNQAVRFATQATDATMYGGGKAARPPILQRFGSMSGVGGVMYTLGSYTLNTIAMMGRLGRKAILDSSLTGPEKTSAMKAFGTMVATQFAFGGALGMPLVAAGLAVLEQIFPGFNAMEFMRGGAEKLGKLATNDEDWGHTLADGAMRGVLNLSPVDVGSRFQLGNLLGVSPYDGFSFANLAGPAGNMLANYVKGVGSASMGNWYDAMRNVLPISAKQIAQQIHDKGDVRDMAGRLIAETTTPEKIGAVLGFKSKKATDYYERQHISQRIEDYSNRQIRDVRSDAAKYLAQGDVQSARQLILQGAQEHGYDPIDMAKEAAQLAVEMQSVVERRRGTRATAMDEAQLASLYPKNVGIGEVQRVLRTAALARQTGLMMGRPNIGELRTASIVDQLMQRDPSLSLTQARMKAEQMTSPYARKRSALSALLQSAP